jgi:hypothetical protein
MLGDFHLLVVTDINSRIAVPLRWIRRSPYPPCGIKDLWDRMLVDI